MDGYGPATYGDGFADVYDDWYAEVGDVAAAVGTIGDLVGAAPPGAGGLRRVLELGVGSGRLAAPLAEAGLEVWGLDASAAMLERVPARPGGDRVRTVLGDMADPLPALEAAGAGIAPRFDAVVVAFNTFFLLADAVAQERCLVACRRLVGDTGVLVIEAYVPADPPTDAETVLEPRRVELDRVVFTMSTHLPMEQVVRGQHVELREDGIRLRPWVLRYLAPAQLDELARDAGLVLRDRWSSWGRDAFDDLATLHVSVYGGR